MEKVSNIKYAKPLFGGIIIGYILACIVFQQVIEIDINSGRVRTKSMIFPFHLTFSHSSRAFEVFFGSKPIGSPEWIPVERKSFIPILGLEGVTTGSMLISGENQLVKLMILTDITRSERAAYANTFMERLREEGVSGAVNYADTLWGEYLDQQSTNWPHESGVSKD